MEYDTETGEFRWILCFRKPWMNGKIATRPLAKGYLYIKADGISHSASRLAWRLYNKREIPTGLVIDHWDRNNINNRGENLRAVTQGINLDNSVRPLGQSGVRGVSIYRRLSGNGNLWRVRLNGGLIYFQTLEEAVGYATHIAERCSK